MCRFATNNVWTLYGIVSEVKTCGVESASVFTRFEAVSHWMEQFTTVDSGLDSPSGDPTYSCGSLRDGSSYKLDDTAYWQSDVRALITFIYLERSDPSRFKSFFLKTNREFYGISNPGIFIPKHSESKKPNIP